MEDCIAKFTVLFSDPWWVGIYERTNGGRYEVCKITFGPEPRDCEVYDFLLENWHRLKFGPSIPSERLFVEKRPNPKRMQRQAREEMRSGIGTKAQQALALQREQGKQTRKELTRAQRRSESERQYALRREKRKAKHRGR